MALGARAQHALPNPEPNHRGAHSGRQKGDEEELEGEGHARSSLRAAPGLIARMG